jgi:ATP-dependent Clp protease ATP-binding subunit ClpA/ActR/RegA family two-component response regulator
MTERLKNTASPRVRKPIPEPTEDLTSIMSSKVVGQPNVINVIVPYIEMFQAGLAPENRPVGVFLLLGPTGTGKTRTVEALAETLHGSSRNVLKIDCGEFQMEHEVAKLIGAPPGYLGHRETQPMLSQQKLTSVTSDKCGLSLVLFDEIEKAAPSLTRLLLGVLDRGVLRLGDNSVVNFEKSLVFLTSNLGAREMMREISPDFGFASATVSGTREDLTQKLQGIALVAVRKKFSPEFINRIDHVITYRPLDAESFSAITDHEIASLQSHVNTRLGNRCFTIEVPFETRQWLIEHGTSAEYGARELKRTIHKNLTQPLATLVAKNQIEPGSRVRVEIDPSLMSLTLRAMSNGEEPAPSHPTVLLVDDNRDLLQFLERLMAESGWELMAAESAGEARKMVTKRKPNAALLDYMLPDGNGVELAQQLKQMVPNLQIIMMTGSMLAPEEEAICEEHDFPVLRKPFLAADVMNQIRSRLATRTTGAR